VDGLQHEPNTVMSQARCALKIASSANPPVVSSITGPLVVLSTRSLAVVLSTVSLLVV
jgi:hypothetical protein